jgi:hypothetical protein
MRRMVEGVASAGLGVTRAILPNPRHLPLHHPAGGPLPSRHNYISRTQLKCVKRQNPEPVGYLLNLKVEWNMGLRLGGPPSRVAEVHSSPGRLFLTMHLLYLDDSGSVGNPQDKHIILAGLSVFERNGHWLSGNLDSLAEQIWPDAPTSLEFRGADIRGGKRHWRGIAKDERHSAYLQVLQ